MHISEQHLSKGEMVAQPDKRTHVNEGELSIPFGLCMAALRPFIILLFVLIILSLSVPDVLVKPDAATART